MTMFEPDADGLLLPVKGLVTVELADARTGRVQHREQVDNFLSLQSLKVARWWQRMMWGNFNPVETADAAGNKPSEMPYFPAQHIAYWNDASAESSGTEDRVAKDLVGWASRHPVGSPSGKRGVVNISESEFKDAYAKWVFDWATSQGNGTFQSVGWTRVDESTSLPIARFPEDDPIAITYPSPGSSLNMQPAAHWDAAGGVWNVAEWYSTGAIFRIDTVPAAGGSATLLTTLAGGTWSSAASLFGLTRLGTDIITCGKVGNPRLARHTVAGAQTWARTESALGSATYNDCTIDGSSNIWTAGSDGVMRRHNSADGTISATVTPAIGFTALNGIAYDAADGNFWVEGTLNSVNHQLVKVDGSGNTVGPLMSLRNIDTGVTSTAPYAGTYQVYRAAAREYIHGLTEYGMARTITAGRTAYLVYGPTLTVKSGEVWLATMPATGTGVGPATLYAARGGTLGTRSKLGSAVTKTNSQTLKVTYQFNFS